MAIITITSDWINDDYYLPAVKGRLYSNVDDCKIVDISHKIPAYDSSRASFILKHSHLFFPKGTIHLLFVNTLVSEKQPPIVAKIHGQYFVGADAGFVHQISEEQPEKVVKIEYNPIMNFDKLVYETNFPELDVFCPIVNHLAQNNSLDELGQEYPEYQKPTPMQATIEKDFIVGEIVYFDSYRNAITNIDKESFDRARKGRDYEVIVSNMRNKVNEIKQRYSDVKSAGDLSAIFNSLNLLEIFMKNYRVADMLKMNESSSVMVKFTDVPILELRSE